MLLHFLEVPKTGGKRVPAGRSGMALRGVASITNIMLGVLRFDTVNFGLDDHERRKTCARRLHAVASCRLVFPKR